MVRSPVCRMEEAHNDTQRMNMFELYSDLYNDLFKLLVVLAIGLLIFIWTGYKKNKEVKALKNKVKDLTSSNAVLMIKVENLVAKLDLSDYRIETLQVNAALKQERISQTESQREKFKMQNSLLQDQIQSLSKKLTTSKQEADEARKSHEEDMKRRSTENELYCSQLANTAENIEKLTKTIQEQESKTDLLSNYLRAAHEQLAVAQEEISQTKSQCVDLERKNRLLQEEIERISIQTVTSDQAAAEAGKSYEEDMKRLRSIFGMKKKEIMNDNLIGQLRAANEQLNDQLAVAQEEILNTKSQCVDLERKNRLLQEEIERISTKTVTSDQAAAEAGMSYEEYMERLRSIYGMKKKERKKVKMIRHLRAYNEKLNEELAAAQLRAHLAL